MRRVEVAGGLVGEQHRRLGHQRAGDGDALLLAAGELGGPVRAAVGEADRARSRLAPSRGRACGRRSTAAGGCSPPPSASGSRLKNWKMKPTWSRRSRVSSLSPIVGDVLAADRDRARGGRSSPARMCMRVDLPEPDGPMTAVNWPAGNLERDAAKGVDGGLALAVAAGRRRRPARRTGAPRARVAARSRGRRESRTWALLERGFGGKRRCVGQAASANSGAPVHVAGDAAHGLGQGAAGEQGLGGLGEQAAAQPRARGGRTPFARTALPEAWGRSW